MSRSCVRGSRVFAPNAERETSTSSAPKARNVSSTCDGTLLLRFVLSQQGVYFATFGFALFSTRRDIRGAFGDLFFFKSGAFGKKWWHKKVDTFWLKRRVVVVDAHSPVGECETVRDELRVGDSALCVLGVVA